MYVLGKCRKMRWDLSLSHVSYTCTVDIHTALHRSPLIFTINTAPGSTLSLPRKKYFVPKKKKEKKKCLAVEEIVGVDQTANAAMAVLGNSFIFN